MLMVDTTLEIKAEINKKMSTGQILWVIFGAFMTIFILPSKSDSVLGMITYIVFLLFVTVGVYATTVANKA